MRELSVVEIDEVSGGRMLDSIPFFTASMAIGSAAFGPSWGVVGVGLAVSVSPLAVGAMAAFALAGGVALMRE